MLNRIRLDDLLGRDLTVHWFEGVAVVQGVCRKILAEGSDARGFPSSANILLRVDGSIELVGTAPPAQSVSAAGHALAQMLGEDTPLRLRLVATQATGGGGAEDSLQDLSDALAYFERPDPEGILRSLYARASGAEHRGPVPTGPSPADSPEEPAPKNPVATTRGRRGRLVLAGIAGIVVCGTIWVFALGSDNPAASAVASVEGVMRSTLARVVSAEPVEKEADSSAKSAAAPPTKTVGSRRAVPVKATKAGRTPTGQSVSAPPLPAVLSMLSSAPLASRAFVLSGPDVAYEIRPDGSPAPRLYSARNLDVVPPRNIYPKLPANPPSGVRLPDDTVLEMVIGTNGLVERVRLRSDPRNIHEFMLLSAAKAWQFEPARLDDTPVRYLHTVILTLR